MLYLSSFDFKGDNLVVTVREKETNKEKILESDDVIKNFIKNYSVLGIRLVCDTLLLTVYNEELIKLLDKKGARIGIKAHLRNWIEAVYAGCNEYEYGFVINGEQVKLSREYLIMQEVKFDVTDKFKSEPKEFKDVPVNQYFFKGYVKETIQPTPEELRAESERRRKEQEKYREEQELKKKEDKLRAKEERKNARLQQKEAQREALENQKRIMEAKRLQERMKQKPQNNVVNTTRAETKKVETVRSSGYGIFNPNKRFRVPQPNELLTNFKTKLFYKGFKILKSINDEELAIVYTREKPIYSKMINGFVPSGGSLIVPIDTVAAVKRWLNAEFYS